MMIYVTDDGEVPTNIVRVEITSRLTSETRVKKYMRHSRDLNRIQWSGLKSAGCKNLEI